MLGSYQIGTVLGIKVRVHWMFIAMIPVLLVLYDLPPAVTLAALTALFGVVFLHELGHSLMARHFGIRVLDITFWPLGGMARMSEIPENSKIEGLIAIAGPAVNFALAFLAAPILIWRWAGGHPPDSDAILLISGWFVGINLMLGGFNLLPAFPMDGGRVLRAFFGRNGDWLGATERAVRVGKFFAVLMFFAGMLFDWGRILPFIAIFVWFAGSRELLAVRMRHARENGTLPGFGNLRDLFEAARQAQPRATGTAGGVREPEFTVKPEPHVQRPVIDLAPRKAPRRLTDDEIERLESFRGRLGRLDDPD